MRLLRLFRFLLLLVSISACVDLVGRETPIYGPYYVADDPAGSYPTLYYRGTDGLAFERFQNVSRVGYTAGYVFIEADQWYYWFAVEKDKATDQGNPAIAALISKPLNQAEFEHLLASLKIEQVEFQFPE
jgi:hypothetical protein